ncbi:hypothetical protein I3843_03G188300 [Carya illinoinensis]|nr:hypothetical protein I3843_03G188300 [Carya illinoinensis]
MKAFYIVSFLLVSIIFVPSSITARELSQKEEKSALGRKLMQVVSTPCGKSGKYTSCLPNAPPKRKCETYSRNCP